MKFIRLYKGEKEPPKNVLWVKTLEGTTNYAIMVFNGTNWVEKEFNESIEILKNYGLSTSKTL